jgi:uncharacterized protein (TIGR02646 family)
MQGGRCAYCEAQLSASGRHIEHFFQRSRRPEFTFAWENLFGSCNRATSCGKYKDASASSYSDTDLIKPDVEDPESFVVFDANGSVGPKAKLSSADHRKASETIRIFNLNGVLKSIRRSELCGYIQTAEAIAEIFEQDQSYGLQCLSDEIAATAALPFSTAIKHVLAKQR